MTDEGGVGWTSYGPVGDLGAGDPHWGVVREWRDEEGWGVIDSPQTPGGCWAHFSMVVSTGYRRLSVGSSVVLTSMAAQQDGYSYRAVRVFPGENVTEREPPTASHGAYRSELTITLDGETVDPERTSRRAERDATRGRLELLDAFVSAVERRSEVLTVIAAADGSDAARDAVAQLLGITDVSALAVLDLQLRRFSREGLHRLRSERDDLRTALDGM